MSLSAWIATLSCVPLLTVMIMGRDDKLHGWLLVVARILCTFVLMVGAIIFVTGMLIRSGI